MLSQSKNTIARSFSVYSPVRGMKDVFPEESSLQSHVYNTYLISKINNPQIIDTMSKYAELSGFKRIDTYILFVQGIFIGSILFVRILLDPLLRKHLCSTKLQEKTRTSHQKYCSFLLPRYITNPQEMYEFQDKSNENICLRPEFTSSMTLQISDDILQVSIEPCQTKVCNTIFPNSIIMYFYQMPMKSSSMVQYFAMKDLRKEDIDNSHSLEENTLEEKIHTLMHLYVLEVLNNSSQILSMLYTTLKSLNAHDQVTLNINSLGDKESMGHYYQLLRV